MKNLFLRLKFRHVCKETPEICPRWSDVWNLILLQNPLHIRKAALWLCIKNEKQAGRVRVLTFYPFPCIEVKIDRFLRYKTSYRKFVSMWCKKVFCNVSKSVTSSISPFKFTYTCRESRNITLYFLDIVIITSRIAHVRSTNLLFACNVSRTVMRPWRFLEQANVSDSVSVVRKFVASDHQSFGIFNTHA